MDQRFDAILMEILRERKTLPAFLDSIFGFLLRKTDFYYVQNKKSETLGFPKDVKERIVYSAMQKYDPECKQNNLVAAEDFVPALEEVEVCTSKGEEQSKSSCVVQETVTKSKIDKKNLSDIDCRNGDRLDNYCWSQTLKDIEIHIRLPENFQSAKTLNVDINSTHIRLTDKQKRINNIILEKKFSDRIKSSSVVWTVSDGKLQINSDKFKEIWWEKLFENDRQIDLSKIDCTRYTDELPTESQAALEKLKFDLIHKDSRRSEQGPGLLEKVEQAWNSENSPFQGQPFDPSIIDIH